MACATLMFLLGKSINTATHECVTFVETLYFCSVTGLTIGYGDVVAATPVGRILVIVVGFLGVLMTGIFTSIAVQRAYEHAQTLAR